MWSRPGETRFARHAAEAANVMIEDAELADVVASERRDAAVRAAPAAVIRVGTGRWAARADADITRGGFGFWS